MTEIDYLNGLAHDIYKYFMSGVLQVFGTMWRVPEIQELIIAAVLTVILVAVLKRFGLRSKHIAIITGIIDLVSAAAYFKA